MNFTVCDGELLPFPPLPTKFIQRKRQKLLEDDNSSAGSSISLINHVEDNAPSKYPNAKGPATCQSLGKSNMAGLFNIFIIFRSRHCGFKSIISKIFWKSSVACIHYSKLTQLWYLNHNIGFWDDIIFLFQSFFPGHNFSLMFLVFVQVMLCNKVFHTCAKNTTFDSLFRLQWKFFAA